MGNDEVTVKPSLSIRFFRLLCHLPLAIGIAAIAAAPNDAILPAPPPVETNAAPDLVFAVDSAPAPPSGMWLNANGTHLVPFIGTNAFVTNEPAGVTDWTATTTNSAGLESLPSNPVWRTNGFANRVVRVSASLVLGQCPTVDGKFTPCLTNVATISLTNPSGSGFYRLLQPPDLTITQWGFN